MRLREWTVSAVTLIKRDEYDDEFSLTIQFDGMNDKKTAYLTRVELVELQRDINEALNEDS